MRVLVTGSSGTIGTRLCEKLLEGGHAVSGIDRVPNKWVPEVQEITEVRDLLKVDAFEGTKADQDLVIHLAANARVYELVKNPSLAWENFTTLFRTLEWTRENSIPRLLFTSSRECYGNVREGKCAEDSVHIETCESPYTASKMGGEALVQAYGRCYSLKPVILRFSNVYGMYDDSDRVVPLFIRNMREGKPITIYGKEKSLDFTYIDDAIDGVMRIMERFDDVAGETFNISSGSATPLLDLAQLIQKILHSQSDVRIEENRTGEITFYEADISKAKEQLGFEPKTSLEEGIKKAVEWYTEGGG